MATIVYDRDGSTYNFGNTGDRWIRAWYSNDIVATDWPGAIVELAAALPDNGTSAPAPLPPKLTIRDLPIERIWNLDGVAGCARGRIIYSVQSDIRSTPPPLSDTESGVVVSSSAYVENTLFTRARRPGTNTLERPYAEWSNGKFVLMPFEAPAYGQLIRFQRNEQTNPRARADLYTGTVNEFSWNLYSPETAFMRNISWETVNGGDYWAVEYEIAIAPTSVNTPWTVDVIGIDLEDGQPYKDPVGDQVRTYSPYQRVDWTALDIVLP